MAFFNLPGRFRHGHRRDPRHGNVDVLHLLLDGPYDLDSSRSTGSRGRLFRSLRVLFGKTRQVDLLLLLHYRLFRGAYCILGKEQNGAII